MSRLWQVRVLDIDNNRARVEVRQAHPDAGRFPTTREFALRLLHEQAWDYDDQFEYRALGALGEACTSKQTLDETWLAGHIDQLIDSVAIEETTGEPLDEDRALAQVVEQLGLPGDPDQLSDLQRQLVDAAYEAFWKDSELLPVARYAIAVPSSQLLSHLSPGQTWPSAAF